MFLTKRATASALGLLLALTAGVTYAADHGSYSKFWGYGPGRGLLTNGLWRPVRSPADGAATTRATAAPDRAVTSSN